MCDRPRARVARRGPASQPSHRGGLPSRRSQRRAAEPLWHAIAVVSRPRFVGSRWRAIVPLNFARQLTGRERTKEANGRLGVVLAFVAGAINAGGFLAVQQYTSHMTGLVSSMADALVLGLYD